MKIKDVVLVKGTIVEIRERENSVDYMIKVKNNIFGNDTVLVNAESIVSVVQKELQEAE